MNHVKNNNKNRKFIDTKNLTKLFIPIDTVD